MCSKTNCKGWSPDPKGPLVCRGDLGSGDPRGHLRTVPYCYVVQVSFISIMFKTFPQEYKVELRLEGGASAGDVLRGAETDVCKQTEFVCLFCFC